VSTIERIGNRRKVGDHEHCASRRSAALLALASLAALEAVKSTSAADPIIIGTASPGGPYLAFGEGIARILSRELGREVTAQATQGPAQIIALLERQEVMHKSYWTAVPD
jgi:TRAP-type uncharacterized transport system substrate-binding protein